MKIGFYPRLAIDGLRKNRRMTKPYILTCMGMVMMFYIVTFLRYSDAAHDIYGGQLLNSIMGFGSGVIGVFACLFLFYTNAFLMRRRRREFGLYNVLGMGKRNIARILFWETLFTALIALGGGLAAGIVLSKLAELGMVNLVKRSVNYKLTVRWESVRVTLITFGAIFVLLLLNSVRQVHFSGALELMKSENAGEKPPRANWALGLLGVIVLAAAYGLAVSIKEPIEAMVLFFVAVVMVIIATYLIMISGSVLLCRLLQKNKRWYYTPAHFVSISSMAYRMKRNGAGLASICILATMVLVMISSTSSLYFGTENVISDRYARDVNIEARFESLEGADEDNIDLLRQAIGDAEKEAGIDGMNDLAYRFASSSGILAKDVLTLDYDRTGAEDSLINTQLCNVFFMPLEDYNQLNGTAIELASDEAMVGYKRAAYSPETLTVTELDRTFRVSTQKPVFPENGDAVGSARDTLLIVLPDFDSDMLPLSGLQSENGGNLVSWRWLCGFDMQSLSSSEAIEKYDAFSEQISAFQDKANISGLRYIIMDSQDEHRDEYFSLYGGLFYLGIVLSIVFLFGAVLIIYYKQIAEGYEDQARFGIMRKVGMTKKEIRRSINSQLLTVFYLPLVLAGLHMVFAFPIVQKMLTLFGLGNIGLFAMVTAISYIVFALLYALVYRITSNAYYNIVSEARPE